MKNTFTQKLPKIILAIIVLSFIVLLVYANIAEKKVDNYFKNGGIEAVALMSDEYDSLVIGDLKFKYPNDYDISQEQGDKLRGEYILLKPYPQDQLIIGYESVKLNGNRNTTIEEVVKINEQAYLNFLRLEKNVNPTPSKVEIKKIGDYDVHMLNINYKNNTLHLYCFESQDHILRLTSHKKHFLDAMIRDIEVLPRETAKNGDTISKRKGTQTEFTTVNNLKIPLYDWKLENINIPEVEMHQIVLQKGEDLIAVMSTTNDYITDLNDYSDYYNEKTVRNMKPTGLILKSKGTENGNFKNTPSVTERFAAFHEPSNTEMEITAITIKINKFFYNIIYVTNPESQQVIENIEIID